MDRRTQVERFQRMGEPEVAVKVEHDRGSGGISRCGSLVFRLYQSDAAYAGKNSVFL